MSFFAVIEVDNDGFQIFDENGNALSSMLDGALRRLLTQGKIENAGGVVINPATQETLAAIRDTDGIKKITDALPIGDNTVGRVKLTDGTEVADITLVSGFNRLETRSIISSADGVNAAAVDDNSRLSVVDEGYTVARDEIVAAEALIEGIATTTYGLVIDLDNPGGFYKHDPLSIGLILYSVSIMLTKEKVNDDWRIRGGPILAIDATTTTVAWLEFLSLWAADSTSNLSTRQRDAFPVPLDVTVVGGALRKIAAGSIDTVVAVNNTTLIPDLSGTLRTPAVGDMLFVVEGLAITGTADLHGSMMYRGVV